MPMRMSCAREDNTKKQCGHTPETTAGTTGDSKEPLVPSAICTARSSTHLPGVCHKGIRPDDTTSHPINASHPTSHPINTSQHKGLGKLHDGRPALSHMQGAAPPLGQQSRPIRGRAQEGGTALARTGGTTLSGRPPRSGQCAGRGNSPAH